MRALRLPLAAVVAAALLPTPALAKPKGQASAKQLLQRDKVVVRAMQQRDRGNLSEAIALLQKAIGKDRRNVGAHRLYQEIAALSRRDGWLVEAEYRHLRDANPGDSLGQLLHASSLLAAAVTAPDLVDRDLLRSVQKELAAAEASEETLAEALFVGADLARYGRDIDETEKMLNQALDAAPKHPGLRSDLTLLYASREQWDRAVPHCKSLLDEAPWRLLACQELFDQDDEKRAPQADQDAIADKIESFEKTYRNDPVVLQSLESFYRGLDEKKGAERVGKRLVEIDNHWTAPLKRNPYLPPLDGGELTREEFDALQELDGLQERKGEDPKTLITALNAFIKRIPELPRIRAAVHRELAFLHRAPGVEDNAASRAELLLGLEATPDDATLLNEWAYMSAVDGVEMEEALVKVERALEIALGRPFSTMDIPFGSGFSDWEIEQAESIGAYVDTRGWIYFQMGRHEDAVRELQMATLLNSDGTVQAHLGRARHALGNDDGAFQNLLRGLALGCEEEEQARAVAQEIYARTHVVEDGLDALIQATRERLALSLGLPDHSLELPDQPTVESRSEPRSESRGPNAKDRNHRLLGKEAPDFTLTRIDGEVVSLSDLRGQVVVVDFWATWCGPCVEAMPSMDAMSRAFAEEKVEFLAVSLDDAASDLNEWVAEFAVEHADTRLQFMLAGPAISDKWGVIGIPATFFIDREGNVATYHNGFEPGAAEQMARDLVGLLAE